MNGLAARAHDDAPVIVVMGVSGCGKSTLAKWLAVHFGLTLIEADDHHSAANRAHMAAGLALTDAMREPFVRSLCRAIGSELGGCVVAFSALRRTHRQRLRALGRPLLFLHLDIDRSRAEQQLRARRSHFMPASLVDSQFDALEPADGEPDVQVLPVNASASELARRAILRIEPFLQQRFDALGGAAP